MTIQSRNEQDVLASARMVIDVGEAIRKNKTVEVQSLRMVFARRITSERLNAIVARLVEAGMIERRGHKLRWVAKL